MNKEIILVLAVSEVDQIGNYLVKQPWVEVNALIGKINQQANDPTIQSYQPPPPPAADNQE